MAAIFGLDFGTTNSVATIIGRAAAGQPEQALVLTNREDGRPHPSVIWYAGVEPVVGRSAKAQLNQLGLGVFGDIVRSPKIFLGSPVGINVSGVNRPTIDVVADVLRFLRADALARGYPQQTFDHAVFTIPVSMQGRARRELRQAALQAGLHVHQFVHEPLAALYGHLRGRPDYQQQLGRLEGRLALVFDWGGGTLDLTLCKFSGGSLIQVLNIGDPEVGGDRFDLRLVQLVKRRHEQQHPAADWTRLQPTAEDRIIQTCEDAKIALSDRESTHIFVPDILAGGGDERHLEVELSRSDLQQEVADLVRRGLSCITKLNDAAEIHPSAIEFCLATGGMVAVPAIRHGLLEIFGMARLHDPDNAATVISEGAAWIAHDGLSLRMAKSIEILHAGNDHVSVVHSGTELPAEGKQIRSAFSMYSVDPRDGFAKFQFLRPKWPEREAPNDPRLTYTHLSVEVDETARPLYERLAVEVRIDHDLIATVSAQSQLRGDIREAEIHDLEFGLGLPPSDDSSAKSAERSARKNAKAELGGNGGKVGAKEAGTVRVRSNVTASEHAWELVPGEIVQRFRSMADLQLTRQQRAEKMYYEPCCLCHRTIHHIERDGCDRCAERGIAVSAEKANARRAVRRTVAAAALS